MKLKIDFRARSADSAQTISSAELLSSPAAHRDAIGDVGAMKGAIILQDEADAALDVYDPLLRLTERWVSKVSWVIGGDTETVAHRDSEHCFAFVPAGDGVEISFYVGTESEIEDYIIEPFTVGLEGYVTQSIALGDNVLSLVRSLDPDALDANEDCRDLKRNLDEAREAWKEYKRQRR
jgi:hypothetical protein